MNGLRAAAWYPVLPLLLLAGCSGGGDGLGASPAPATPPQPQPLDSSPFPAARDAYDGDGADDRAAGATELRIGESQARTVFPVGDVDFVKLTLNAGMTYELSTTRLNYNGDTYLELLAADGTTHLAGNDDYLKLDSRIVYTPSVNGTYYLKVSAFNARGVASYTLSARVFQDRDGDGVSDLYDCNDGDAHVHPAATDIAGDGVDQNCSERDQPPATAADDGEADDSPGAARPMAAPAGAPDDPAYRLRLEAANARTLHAAGQADFFSLVVPARGAVEIDLLENHVGGVQDLTATVYGSDGVTVIDTSTSWPYFVLENPSDAAQNVYVRYSASSGIDVGYYVPYYAGLGVDVDGDGYYSQDWADLRDCDDASAAANPGAADTTVDGIDQNCNGTDGA